MTNDNISKICVSAGGTGGHVFAAIPVIQAMLREQIKVQVITDTRGLKYYDCVKNQVQINVLALNGLGKQSIISKLYGMFFMAAAIASTLIKFITDRPNIVIGFGGHPAFPAVLSAAILRIPIIIHEQNSVFGKANRMLAKFAKAICLSYSNTAKVPPALYERIVYTGMPVREEVLTKLPYAPLHKNKLTIFIMGGSQGSNIFSQVVPQAVAKLSQDVKKQLIIIQQCRLADIATVKQTYDNLKIKNQICEFFDNVPEILSTASLVISRSGAGSVNEITNAHVPAIYVPYIYASDNHQYYNASEICKAKGAWIIEQKDFNADSLEKLLSKLANKPMILSQFSANLEKIAVSTATENLMQTIINVNSGEAIVNMRNKPGKKERKNS